MHDDVYELVDNRRNVAPIDQLEIVCRSRNGGIRNGKSFGDLNLVTGPAGSAPIGLGVTVHLWRLAAINSKLAQMDGMSLTAR